MSIKYFLKNLGPATKLAIVGIKKDITRIFATPIFWFKKIIKPARLLVKLFFVLSFLLILFLAFNFLRYRQICRYKSLVDSGQVTSPTNSNLCPNFLSASAWPTLVQNSFNPKLPKALSINSNYTSDSYSLAQSDNCTDELNPACWLAQIDSSLAQTDGFTNFLMVGSDTRMEDGSIFGNTDSIMLISYEHSSGNILLISFTRDLLVNIDTLQGWRASMKINTVYPFYGKDTVLSGISEITGKPIHYYALYSFDTFRKLIDQLGGVDIYLEKEFKDLFPCDELPASKACYNPGGHGWIIYPAGWNHFDSWDALIFARARYSSSDYDRASRQQQLVEAVLQQSLKQEIPLIEKFNLYKNLYSTLVSGVDTNVSLADIAGLMKIYNKITENPANIVVDPYLGGDGEIIYEYGVEEGVGWVTKFYDYTYGQFQNYIANIWKYLPYYSEQPKILVINATGEPLEESKKTSEFLKLPNPYWEVKVIEKNLNYTGTRLYDFSNSAKKGSLSDISEKLNGIFIFNAQIDGLEKSEWGEDILIILGKKSDNN